MALLTPPSKVAIWSWIFVFAIPESPKRGLAGVVLRAFCTLICVDYESPSADQSCGLIVWHGFDEPSESAGIRGK
jgi:hypothetical protein